MDFGEAYMEIIDFALDKNGLLLVREQAELFSNASNRGFGSYYFLRKFAYSDYCRLLDTKMHINQDTFWKDNEKTLIKRGVVLPANYMHWIGYIYRYWCYVEGIELKQLIKIVPISYLAGLYNSYHSGTAERTIMHIKDKLSKGKILGGRFRISKPKKNKKIGKAEEEKKR